MPKIALILATSVLYCYLTNKQPPDYALSLIGHRHQTGSIQSQGDIRWLGKSTLPVLSPDGNLSRYLDQIRTFPMLGAR